MTVPTPPVLVREALLAEYDRLTPQWWAQRLQPKVDAQAAYAKPFDEHYSGDRHLAMMRAEYDRLFGLAIQAGYRPAPSEVDPPKSALASIGIDVLSERLDLRGFADATAEGVGEGLAAGDDDGPADERDGPGLVPAVTEGWMRNDMDVMAPVAHVELMVKARVIVLIWPDRETGKAVVTVEDPSQVAIARRSRPPYDALAGMKVYTDEWTGDLERLVWLPDGMHTLREVNGKLVEDERAFQPAPQVLNGELPLVEMANRTRLLREPSSALTHVAPYADADALLMGWMLIAARFGALPLVTLAGQQLPRLKRPDGSDLLGPDGLPVVGNPYDVRADSLLVAEDPQAKWGKLESSSLAGFVATLQEVRVAVRGITKVPALYYGEGTSAGQSGETVRAAESPLVHTAYGMHRTLGHGWRRAAEKMHLIDTGQRLSLVARWGSPETFILAAAVDAAQKYEAAGVPLQVALEQTGMAPDVVRRAMRLAKEQNAQKEAQQIALAAAVRGDALSPAFA